jgi:hypothetical protein
VADSAFVGKRPYLVLSGQEESSQNAAEVLEQRDATSVRQMAEWGMRQIKAKFPRLCHGTILLEDQGQRLMDISLMVRLYNHQVQAIGMNQILSTFMPQRSAERRYFQQTTRITDDANDVIQQFASDHVSTS